MRILSKASLRCENPPPQNFFFDGTAPSHAPLGRASRRRYIHTHTILFDCQCASECLKEEHPGWPHPLSRDDRMRFLTTRSFLRRSYKRIINHFFFSIYIVCVSSYIFVCDRNYSFLRDRRLLCYDVVVKYIVIAAQIYYEFRSSNSNNKSFAAISQ